MPNSVQFSFFDGNGTRLFTSNDITSATWARSLNSVGKAVIEVPSKAPNFDFETVTQNDFGMVIETATEDGVPFQAEFQTYWFLQKIRETHNEQEEVYVMTFSDAITLLDRRIVPFLSDPRRGGVSRTFLDGQAAIEMARTINNVLGSNAPPDLALEDFTIAPVGFVSPTLRKGIAFRRVLNVLTQVSRTAKFNGTAIYFDIIANPSPSGVSFSFQLFKDQRGADKRDVILRTSDPLFRLDYFELNRDVPNDAIVSGAGRETDRLVGRATTPEATASKYSRRQTFKFSVSRDLEVLESEAEQLVANAGGTIKIKAQLLGDLANQFTLGDRLLIQHRNILIDCVISSIRVDVEDQVIEREITLTSLASSL